MAEEITEAPIFPPETIPTIFADGIINLAQSGEVVKFYLARNDASTNTASDNKLQLIGQIVMTMTGFINMASFFEQALDGFVAKGIVPAERRNAVRQSYKMEPK